METSKHHESNKDKSISIEEFLEKAIIDEIDSVENDWSEIEKEIKGEHDLKNDIEIIRAYLDSLKHQKRIGSDEIFKSIVASGNLTRQIIGIWKKIKNNIPKAYSLFSKLLPKIKNISSYLYQLLSQHKNLKEWTISFGIHGNVNLQLTFDKNSNSP